MSRILILVISVVLVLSLLSSCSNSTPQITADDYLSLDEEKLPGNDESTYEISQKPPEEVSTDESDKPPEDDNTNEPDQPPEEVSTDKPDQPSDKPPEDENTGEPDPAVIIPEQETFKMPEYEIRQTLYQEIRADDGVLLACNEYLQPVFTGTSAPVNRMNEAFKNDLVGVNTEDFDYLPEMYNSREGYVYDEAQSGRVGGYKETWSESFRLNEYISFAASGVWDGLGAHGGFAMIGRTFDASTGEVLKIADILTIAPEQIQNTLYKEYIAYHYMLGDGFGELARGIVEDHTEKSYIDSVKEQCGMDAVFWLSDDGIHIFFHQYTFYYAVGMSELVIPYTRDDLVRAPFAART